MRKLWILLAAVFATSLIMTAGVDAANYPTKSKAPAMKSKTTQHKATMKSKPARTARGPVCKVKHRKKVARRSMPARVARGPMVTCPAPVVNVPQQAAPVINVPAQAAPVVNVPPAPPTVGITVDNCSIFIVRENQLTVLDKNTYEVKKTVPLQ